MTTLNTWTESSGALREAQDGYEGHGGGELGSCYDQLLFDRGKISQKPHVVQSGGYGLKGHHAEQHLSKGAKSRHITALEESRYGHHFRLFTFLVKAHQGYAGGGGKGDAQPEEQPPGCP